MKNSLTLFYLGGSKRSGWLLCTTPQRMPQIGWFFMILFLLTFERSLVGHFWDFFLKISKNFTLTIFFIQNQKGEPFYTCKNALFIGPSLGSKIVLINLLMLKIGAKIVYFCQNMHFHQALIALIGFNRGDRFDPPNVITYIQKPM